MDGNFVHPFRSTRIPGEQAYRCHVESARRQPNFELHDLRANSSFCLVLLLGMARGPTNATNPEWLTFNVVWAPDGRRAKSWKRAPTARRSRQPCTAKSGAS